MLRVGLTGGIACGKTTVSTLFGQYGAPIVDADVLAREAVLPGSAGLAEIVDRFGTGVLTAQGALDRLAMRQLIFSDHQAKQYLENILHPRIRQQMARAIQQFKSNGYAYCISVIPLLFETSQQDTVDRVLVIDCEEAVQIARIMARDASTREEAEQILAVQIPRAQRMALADDLIENNQGPDQLEQRVADLHNLYLAYSSS